MQILSKVQRYLGGLIKTRDDGAIWTEAPGSVAQSYALGVGAIDIQSQRSADNKVARDRWAVCIGADNATLNGNATNYGATAIGWTNTCSGTGTGVAIGRGNTAAGVGVAIGYNNQTGGDGDAALGSGCSSGGSGSLAAGNTCSSGTYGSSGIGFSASTSNRGAFCFGAAGTTAATGANQVGLYCSHSTATSDTTPTVVATLTRFVIPAKRVMPFSGFMTAYSNATDTYRVKLWKIEGVITRDASNSTRIVGTPVITEIAADTDAASWAVTGVSANDTYESLEVTVTGEAATSILWQLTLFTAQLGYA